MRNSRSALRKDTIILSLVGSRGWTGFWDERFLPRWLPLALALVFGVLLGLLIANEAWYFVIVLAVAAPVGILLSHYPFAAVMIWMLLMPYSLNSGSSDPRMIFWLLHRMLVPAALVITTISGWLGINRRTKNVSLGLADLAMLLFLGLTIANIIVLNSDTRSSLIELYDQIAVPFLMYWLIRLCDPDEEDLKRFLIIAAITILVQAAIGILGRFVPQVLPSSWIQGAERTVGSLLNGAVYTSTLVFLSLLLFQYAMNCESKRIRNLFLGLFGLTIFSVFISFSRGSWLGGLFVLAGLIALYPKTLIRLLIVMGLLVLVVGGGFISDEIAFGYERLTGSEGQRSASNRVISNQTSMLMIQTKPWFGWGFNNYDLYYEPFITGSGDLPSELGYGVTSHNTYLTIVTELGVIAAFLYVFPSLWLLFLSKRAWRHLPSQGFMSRRLLIVLWLVMLHMLVVSNFMDMIRFYPFGTTIWWMTQGLIASIVYRYLKQDELSWNPVLQKIR